jgi:hypothetical protein
MLQSKIQENGYEREQRVFLLRMTPAEVLTHFAVASEARALAEKSEALVPGWLDQEMDDHDKRHGRKDEHLKATKPYYWILDGQHRSAASVTTTCLLPTRSLKLIVSLSLFLSLSPFLVLSPAPAPSRISSRAS